MSVSSSSFVGVEGVFVCVVGGVDGVDVEVVVVEVGGDCVD